MSGQPEDRDSPDFAARLLAAREQGDFSPAFLAGELDLAKALDLQLAVLQNQLASGRRVGGWKVGLTSEASRIKLGADERPFGFVLADRVFETGASIDSSVVQSLSIEAEMCFTVGADIDDPSIAPNEILDHMSGVSAGFELNEARPGSVRPDFFAMVADCLTNWGIAAGPAGPPPAAHELSATTITMARNGEQVFSGVSKDFVDDHTISLCRLVEQLARHGQGLIAGQKVITGAFARFLTEPGDQWSATFANIGTVEIDIT